MSWPPLVAGEVQIANQTETLRRQINQKWAAEQLLGQVWVSAARSTRPATNNSGRSAARLWQCTRSISEPLD